MKKKITRLLLATALLSIGLAFSVYGEDKTITSIPLSFSWNQAPRGGEFVGEIHATSSNSQFIIEGSEYLKQDDTWTFGEWPVAEIELSAKDGYHFSSPSRKTFSLSGCNVQYKSAETDEDGSTMILQVYLARLNGQLPGIPSISWSGTTALWDAVDGADEYEIRLSKDNRLLATVTAKGTSYDFSSYINNEGSYTFIVRAASTYSSQNGSWSASSEVLSQTRENAWYSDNGTWKKLTSGWRFLYGNDAYPTGSWRCIDDSWYYFDRSGYMVTESYVKALDENRYYWIGADGKWDTTGDTENPNRAAYTIY